MSLSTLAHELHATIGTIQWVTSGYLLALALMLPLTGWTVDRLGTKRLYLTCFSTFTLASVLCGFSRSTASLIGFRVLQGMAGGLLAPMVQMMMARFAGRQMARFMGYGAFAVLLGPLLGPAVAGMIVQHASWRWLFFINLPIGVLAVALAILFLPDDRHETKVRVFDSYGFLLLSPGLVLLLYGTDHASQRVGASSLLAALVLLSCFIAHARRKGRAALIDLRLFGGSVFSCAAITQFLANGIALAGQVLIPLYLTLVCHLSPSRTGWFMAPVGIGMLCSMPLLGYFTERFGFRPVASAGAFVGMLSVIPFAYMAVHALLGPVVFIALFLRGAGLGCINVPSMSAAYATIPGKELPMATTALNIVQRLGGPMLTTIVSVFLAWQLRTAAPMAHPNKAFAAAFWFLSAFHVLCFVFTLGLPRFVKHHSEIPVSELSE